MTPLIDPFARQVTYLRVSVTDRCDLRCTYCMSERMTFLPKNEVLDLDELATLTHAFIDRGVRKVRISGGEPLVRKDVMDLMRDISKRPELNELTLTTNGTRLTEFADDLAAMGVRRVNVSLDTLRPDVFARLTRRDRFAQVMDGLKAATTAGLKIKLNSVLLPDNIDDVPDMVSWAHDKGYDISFIEIMPMGDTGADRRAEFVPMTAAKMALHDQFTLTRMDKNDPDAGPSRYHHITETGGRVGFISPLTNNFCAGCNRVRLTCEGKIYQCLGREDHVDLRAVLRAGGDLNAAINTALGAKPERHDFAITDRPSVSRHMSVTGG